MWAIITNEIYVVAKDFPTKPAALAYIKFNLGPNIKYEVVNQNSQRYINIDMRRYHRK